MTADNREAFEVAYARRFPIAASTLGKFNRDALGDYEDTTVLVAWWGWCAALASREDDARDAKVQVPPDLVRYAKAMQADGYRGPLRWASAIIDWVASTPPDAQARIAELEAALRELQMVVYTVREKHRMGIFTLPIADVERIDAALQPKEPAK